MEKFLTFQIPHHKDLVLQSLYRLQQRGYGCDTTLKAKDGEVKVHGLILAAFSQVHTRSNLESTCSWQVLAHEINCMDYAVQIIKSLVVLLYTGQIVFQGDLVVDVYKLCCDLKLHSVCNGLQGKFPHLLEPHNDTNGGEVNDSGETHDESFQETKPDIRLLNLPVLKQCDGDNPSELENSRETNNEISHESKPHLHLVHDFESEGDDGHISESEISDDHTNNNSNDGVQMFIKVRETEHEGDDVAELDKLSPTNDEKNKHEGYTEIRKLLSRPRADEEENKRKGHDEIKKLLSRIDDEEIVQNVHLEIMKLLSRTDDEKNIHKAHDEGMKQNEKQFIGESSTPTQKLNAPTARTEDSDINEKEQKDLKVKISDKKSRRTLLKSKPKRISLSREKVLIKESTSKGDNSTNEPGILSVVDQEKTDDVKNRKEIAELPKKRKKKNEAGSPGKKVKNKTTKSVTKNNEVLDSDDETASNEKNEAGSASKKVKNNKTTKCAAVKDEALDSDTDTPRKEKKNNYFKCVECNIEFSKYKDRAEHMREVHKPFTCDLCGWVGVQPHQYAAHMYGQHKVVINPERYPLVECPEEGCTFKSISCRMRDHVRSHKFKVDKLVCHVCGMEFTSSTGLLSHSSYHKEADMKYKCRQCGKVFGWRHALNKHLTAEHNTYKLCHICTFKAKSKTSLAVHLHMVHGEPIPANMKKYECDHCDFYCFFPSYLKIHLQEHSDVMNFKCSECPKEFKTKKSLRSHKENSHSTHFYHCDKCDYKTRALNTLQTHEMSSHSELRPFSCHLCSYSCKLKGNLNSHLKNIHKVELVSTAKIREQMVKTGKGYDEYLDARRNLTDSEKRGDLTLRTRPVSDGPVGSDVRDTDKYQDQYSNFMGSMDNLYMQLK